MSEVKKWTGLLYADGELRRAEVINDGKWTNLWISDNLRDDIDDADDLNENDRFFDNEDDFARWIRGGWNDALTPAEVWEKVA